MEFIANPSLNKQNEIAYIQKLLNVFVFFITFPCIALFGNSITFYIFIIILLRLGLFWQRPFRLKSVLFLFLIIVSLSTLFAPYSRLVNPPELLDVLLLFSQVVYWILMASLFIVYRKQINWYQISRSIFWGIIVSGIGFYLIDYKFSIFGIEFTTALTRNSFVFDVLALTPLACNYVIRRYNKNGLYLFMIFVLFLMLLSNGRSGAIIITLEILLIVSLYSLPIRRFVRIALLPLLAVFYLAESSTFQPILETTASRIEVLSPRMASLMRNEGDGDLTQDKSWLLRKLMVEKGIEIANEYPILGIGLGNFKYYSAELESFLDNERLAYVGKDFMNSRSAHNSYAVLLSEFGIFGLITFIILVMKPVLFFIKQYLFAQKLTIMLLPLISLIAILIHFYAVANIYGGVTWFVIGSAIASIYDE